MTTPYSEGLSAEYMVMAGVVGDARAEELMAPAIDQQSAVPEYDPDRSLIERRMQVTGESYEDVVAVIEQYGDSALTPIKPIAFHPTTSQMNVREIN